VVFLLFFDANFFNQGTLILISFCSGSSNAGGQWAAGDEPLYYIVSPKDIVVAKPRFVKILQSKISFFRAKARALLGQKQEPVFIVSNFT
jgi:hypothetical protein